MVLRLCTAGRLPRGTISRSALPVTLERQADEGAAEPGRRGLAAPSPALTRLG